MKKEVFICPECNFNLKKKEYERSAEFKARVERLKNNKYMDEKKVDALLENNKTNPNLDAVLVDVEKKLEMASSILDGANTQIKKMEKINKKVEPIELPFEIKKEVLAMDTRSGRKLSDAVQSLISNPLMDKEGKIDLIKSDIFNIGLDYEKKGDFDNAIIAYEEVIRIGGDAPIYFINLTNIYRKLRQWDDEIRICEKAVEQIGTIYETPYDAGIFESRKNLVTDFKIHENDKEGIISEFF